MSFHRHGRFPSRGAFLGLAACSLAVIFALQLDGAPADSAPQLVSATGGKNGARWSNVTELKKAAEANDPVACAQYGEILLRGYGVSKDTVQARMYLQLAADHGEPNAAFRLGKIYDDGELAPQDYAKALAYYTAAAKAGVSEAQYNLGVMYTSARGVKRDYVEGLAWLIVATKNGAPDDGEKEVRERLQTTKRQPQITAAEKRAEEILKDIAAAVPGANAATTATPPKPQAPAKIDLGGSAPPAKITVAAPAPPLPAVGNTLGGGPISIPARDPADAENKDSQPKKSP